MVVFRFCLHLRGVLKEGAQTAVLCPLRIRVVRRHIRGKEHIAQQGIDRGKGAFLLCRQLAVFLPEEEHIRVAAIEMCIRDRVETVPVKRNCLNEFNST